jgi:hypothetical protein
MNDFRKTPRVATLLGVLLLHAGVIALLLTASRTQQVVGWADHAVEVTYYPPTKVAQERPRFTNPRQVRVDNGISLAPPDLDSWSLATSVSGSDGDGAAVNWAAEAHRAVRAFEIRRDHPASNELLGASPWDLWWPQRKHHAGDRSRTASGDWIVWINADCYQVAKWHSGAPPADEAPPPTVCPHDAGTHESGTHEAGAQDAGPHEGNHAAEPAQ